MASISRRNFVLSLGALAGSAALAGCGGSGSTDSGADAAKADSYTLVEDGKLTVAAELGFAPFEYMD